MVSVMTSGVFGLRDHEWALVGWSSWVGVYPGIGLVACISVVRAVNGICKLRVCFICW